MSTIEQVTGTTGRADQEASGEQPRPPEPEPTDWPRRHVEQLVAALRQLGEGLADVVRTGQEIGAVLRRGGRVLALGNGGSAAQAQHLTAELVGRYRSDRPGLSALSLVGDLASLTALANDFGADALFARQVEAHGRPGDVLVALSTSGRSPNVLAAVHAARRLGMTVVALTGPAPSPLAELADRCLAVSSPPGPGAATPVSTATVQEVHQVMIHLLCAAIDEQWERASAGPCPDLRPGPGLAAGVVAP